MCNPSLLPVTQVVLHGCGVERVNKDHQSVHTKARASLSESTTTKALYCYTNTVLELKLKMSFEQFCSSVLMEEDSSVFLETAFEWSDDDEDMTEARLPNEQDEDDGADSDWDSEDEDADDHELSIPDGFSAVCKPVALPTGTDLHGLYVIMLWSCGWETGKVKAYKPTRRRHNFDILWDEGVRGSTLRLDTYHLQSDESTAREGDWVFMRKSV